MHPLTTVRPRSTSALAHCSSTTSPPPLCPVSENGSRAVCQQHRLPDIERGHDSSNVAWGASLHTVSLARIRFVASTRNGVEDEGVNAAPATFSQRQATVTLVGRRRIMAPLRARGRQRRDSCVVRRSPRLRLLQVHDTKHAMAGGGDPRPASRAQERHEDDEDARPRSMRPVNAAGAFLAPRERQVFKSVDASAPHTPRPGSPAFETWRRRNVAVRWHYSTHVDALSARGSSRVHPRHETDDGESRDSRPARGVQERQG